MFISRNCTKRSVLLCVVSLQGILCTTQSLKGNKTKDISWPVNMKHVYLQASFGRYLNIHTTQVRFFAVYEYFIQLKYFFVVCMDTDTAQVCFLLCMDIYTTQVLFCVLCMNISTAQVLFFW